MKYLSKYNLKHFIKQSRIYLYLIVVLLFYANNSIIAKSQEPSITKNEAISYIKEAEQILSSDPQRAVSLANRAIYYAQKSGDNALLVKCYLINDQAYKSFGDFLTGFKYVNDAYNICPTDSTRLKAQIILRLSYLYTFMRDLNRASELVKEAKFIGESTNDSLIIAESYNNMGLVNIYIPDNELAERNFNMALEINSKIGNKKGMAKNLNNLALYDNGNPSKKIEQLHKAIEINKESSAYWSLAENYNNLGVQHFYAKEYNKALSALNKAKEYCIKIGARELKQDNNRYFSQVYQEIKDYKRAHEHISLVLEDIEREKMVEQMRAHEGDLIQDTLDGINRAVLEQQQRAEIIKMRYIISLILSLLILTLATSLYLGHRSRGKRRIIVLESANALERQERESALREKEIISLKLEQREMEANEAEKKLDNIREQLVNTAFFMKGRNEMLSNIQNEIKEACKLHDNDRLHRLQSINRSITQFNDKSNEMILLVDKLNSSYLLKLSEKYPYLTQNEMRLASLLRIGLSSKEIAIMISSQPKTVDMARYRLRKKMQLDSEEKLQECLSKVSI